MEIVQERLEREYDLDLIVTAPSVVYKVHMNDGSVVDVDSPAKLVDADQRQKVTEPYVAMEIFCPQEYTGALMELCQARACAHAPTPRAALSPPPAPAPQSRRGLYKDQKFLTENRVAIKCGPASRRLRTASAGCGPPQATPRLPTLTVLASGTTCRWPRSSPTSLM